MIATTKKKSLETWIHEAIIDEDKDGKITMMALMHQVGMQEQEIHITRFGGKAWSAKDLATMFQGKAEAYSQELNGEQKFVLLAFYDARNQPEARHIFTTKGKASYDGETEPPTHEGRTMQIMKRETEFTQQVFTRQRNLDEFALKLLDAAHGENTSVRTYNKELLSENKDAWTCMRDMMMKMVTLNHESKMKEMEFQRASEERKKWLEYAPLLINTILNREVFPQSSVDSSIIDNIAKEMSDDDIKLLEIKFGHKPELWGPLSARLEKSLKERRIAAEGEALTRKALLSGNPEDDAAGDVDGVAESLRNGKPLSL